MELIEGINWLIEGALVLGILALFLMYRFTLRRLSLLATFTLLILLDEEYHASHRRR